jgi:Spy/CpxP family protein refolding chaperone
MKRYMLLGALMVALAGAGSLAAQETPVQPERPQARMRLHAPGTGLQPGVTPMWRQRGAERGRMGHAGFADRAFTPRALIYRREFLGLSDQQVAELERLDAAVQATRDKALTEAKTHQEALAEAWKADKPDANAVRNHAQAAMRAHQEVQLEVLNAAARAKATLTAEQLGKVRGLQEGQRARLGARGRVGMGRGMRAAPRAPRPRQRIRRPDLM